MRLVAVLAAALLAAGCTGAPTQEMSDARQAVGAARDALASEFTPEAYQLAVSRLDQATRLLQAGEYTAARGQAVAAREAAIKARRMAAAIGEAEQALAASRGGGAARRDAGEALAAARDAARAGDDARAVELAEQATRQAGGR